MRHTGAWTALAVSAAAVAVAAAQEPAPQEGPDVTFSVEVNLVEVDVRVLDSGGAFVRDLAQDDFEIFEDGVAQVVDRFALVDIPVEAPEKPLFADGPIDPDVASNARDFDGRLYLIVLDDLHTSPLRTQLVRKAARQFIETKLGFNDRAAVMTTRGATWASQGFTGSRRVLLGAIDNFIGQKAPSRTIVAVNTPHLVAPEDRDVRFDAGSDPDQLQRALDANAAMITLQNAAEFMASVHGRRKALVYISEGIDYDVYDALSNRESSRLVASAHEAVAAATRANVSIYTIDPRGLTTMGDDVIELSSGSDDLAVQALSREMQIAHDGLRVLAAGTGGFSALNTADFDRTFDRIVEENSAYYLLGYYATNSRREGKTRRLDVRARRSGVRVLARDSYIEPRGGSAGRPPSPALRAPAELLDVLRSPLPLSGLTLSATAAPFRGDGKNASVAVVVEARGSELGLEEEGDRHTGALDVAVWAMDPGGRPGESERIVTNLNLRPDSFRRVTEFGLRLMLRLDVPPGRYQFRVGALTPATGLRGSVFYDLEVPDFTKGALSMSGLMITSQSASRTLTARPDPVLGEVLPASPTTRREFPMNDEIAVFAEVYDNDRTPHRVDITANILTNTGDLVFTSSESRSNAELGGSVGGYGYVTRIPLGSFDPGLYVLRLQARSRAGASEPVVREVQFRIQG